MRECQRLIGIWTASWRLGGDTSSGSRSTLWEWSPGVLLGADNGQRATDVGVTVLTLQSDVRPTQGLTVIDTIGENKALRLIEFHPGTRLNVIEKNFHHTRSEDYENRGEFSLSP